MTPQQAINMCHILRLNIEAQQYNAPANIGYLKVFKLDYDRARSRAHPIRRLAFCRAFGHVAAVCGYTGEMPQP